MLRKLLALIMFALMVFGATAQDEACSIFAISPFGDGGHTLAVYMPDGGGYAQIASSSDENAAQIAASHLSNEHVRAAVVMREDIKGSVVNFYTLQAAAMILEGQVNVGDAVPRAGGWSFGGRYLALQGTGGTLESRTLLVYDTQTGTLISFGAVLEEFGVSWAPGQDTIAYVAADGIYAASPDGAALWSLATGLVSRVQWLSGTELAVTRCDDTCEATIVDVFTGEQRRLDFGAYVPEAYIRWRDSYIVSRISDGVVGLWDRVNGFRSYTGSSVVTSRPTLTSDGRHLSVHVKPNIRPGVLIGDLFDSKLWYTLPLNEPTEKFTNAPFGDWNVREQKFLYTDAGLAWVYDAIANESAAVIDNVESAQWVCPSRG